MSDQEYYSDEESQGGLRILMVAEKNSIAETISYALGKPRAKKGRMSFFYFSGQFQGKQASFTVTATNGHVYNRDFPPEYQDWSKVDPIELFNAKTIKKPSNKSTAGLLARASKNIDHLILWLDNDREGENICFEVDEICNPRKNVNVLRAKFSSITPQDIRIAFASLKYGPNLNESLSVDARQIIDLKIGVAFSRFQTMYFNQKYQNDQMVTFGPCQTPTLGFCVARVEEIQSFIPKTYYRPLLTIASEQGFKQECEWQGEHIFKEQDANKLILELKKFTHAKLIGVQTTMKSKVRPDGINTVAMLKFASSCLGIGPQQAMHLAEHLYLSGYISYPRTETTAFAKGFPSEKIVQALQRYDDVDIVKYCKQLKIQNTKAGVDKGDHPPITPTENVPRDINGQERGLYEYIVKMFLAAHSGDCKYEHMTMRVSIKDQEFKLSGNLVVDPGFTGIATWLNVASNVFDPKKYISNDQVKIASIDIKVGQTSPPDNLTETELITLMDKFGIGTDASMATHINNICERNYVKVEGGNRRLVPTDLGLSLVRGYKKIDPDLVAPHLRSNIESQVDLIAKGKAQFQAVVDDVIRIFTEKYKYFRTRIHDMNITPQQNFNNQSIIKRKIPAEAKPFTKCGDCNRFMLLINNTVRCETCDKTYKLMADCKYRDAGTQECPLDKFQLIMCTSIKSPYINTFMCPKCLTQSPLTDSDQCVCNVCPQKDCQYSFIKRLLGKCPHCNVGELILEPFLNKGSVFNVSCNECWCLYQPVPLVQNVKLSTKCQSCNLLKLAIDLKDKDSTKHEKEHLDICLICDPLIQQKLLFAKYGNEKRLMNQHQKQQQPIQAKNYKGKGHRERRERDEVKQVQKQPTLDSLVDQLLLKKK